VRRRDFTAGLFIAASTRSAWAQALATPHRIAFVSGAPPTAANWREAPLWRKFFSELRRLGYVEGNNLVVERFSAEGRSERYADVAQGRRRSASTRLPDGLQSILSDTDRTPSKPTT
jgi:putative ABC transport system substrate-binding protein